MSSLTFPKSHRLLNASDFQSVFADATHRVSHPLLLILARPNQQDVPKLGLVIAKKNIRLATNRNRIKRIIRENFRLRKGQLAGMDLVVLARRGLDKKDNQALHSLIAKQLNRVGKAYAARCHAAASRPKT